MAGDDEEQLVQPHHAHIEDEFLRHPESGAYIRNPFRQKGKSVPIMLSASEFDFNGLDEALSAWNCICVTASSLRDVIAGPQQAPLAPLSPTRVSLCKLHDLPSGYDFVISLRKSSYTGPRRHPRQVGSKEVLTNAPQRIDKVGVDVVEVDDSRKLHVEDIGPLGLVADWNRLHPNFAVKVGDEIVGVNSHRLNAGTMLEELNSAADALRIVVHRSHPPAADGAGELTTPRAAGRLPRAFNRATSHDEGDQRSTSKGVRPVGRFSAASLASPDQKAAKRTRPAVAEEPTAGPRRASTKYG